MDSNIKPDRDPFTFSLRGIGVANGHSMVPAVAGDAINRAWDARLRRASRTAPAGEAAVATRQVEALLARYFAHGCC
jgi:hypothetical protein